MIRLSGQGHAGRTGRGRSHRTSGGCARAMKPHRRRLGLPVDPQDITATRTPLYLTGPPEPAAPGPALQLPAADWRHIAEDDIIGISPDGSRITVLWKSTAMHNSLLLTEQCDNYCLMCSQPPKTATTPGCSSRAKRIVSLLPPTAPEPGPHRRRANPARGCPHRPARALPGHRALAAIAPAIERPAFRRYRVRQPLRRK